MKNNKKETNDRFDKQCRGAQMRPYWTSSVRQVVPPSDGREFHEPGF